MAFFKEILKLSFLLAFLILASVTKENNAAVLNGSSCVVQPQEINVCDKIKDSVNIAASILQSLPHMEGPRGEQGPVGPKGVKGSIGEKGDRGDRGSSVKGQKGNQGQQGQKGAPQNLPRMSAFSVHRTSSMDASGGESVITYTHATLNIGSDMNIDTGYFTCEIPGVYYFSYTIETEGDEKADVQLMKNGDLQNDIGVEGKTGSRKIMQSQSIILSLSRADRVNLRLTTGSMIDDTPNKRNTFNGYLIFEQ